MAKLRNDVVEALESLDLTRAQAEALLMGAHAGRKARRHSLDKPVDEVLRENANVFDPSDVHNDGGRR